MQKKPRLSFWQIWNMNFGFLGIQFGYALQNANVSRIFETLGASIESIPILWIAAPITGLIVQPIIGHYSDKTWNKMGRRRPYFLIGAILASIALIFMPNSPTLWIAAGMLWIMDASINVSMEPFRAFVGDMLPNEQRTQGFTMQSFFIGIGAVVASALPWMMTNWFGIENTAPEGVIPDSVKFAFYLGAIAFFAAVAVTVFSTKEYSPEQLEEFEKAEGKTNTNESINTSATDKKASLNKAKRTGIIFSIIGALFTAYIYFNSLMSELYILSIGLFLFGLLEIMAYFLQHNKTNQSGFIEIINDFNGMPKTMKQLAIVQFFSWFALFAMWIYSVSGITSHIYDMKVDANIVNELKMSIDRLPESIDNELFHNKETIYTNLNGLEKKLDNKSETHIGVGTVKFFIDEKKSSYFNLSSTTTDKLKNIQSEYNKGADWVGVGFAVYNGFAAVFAFLLVYLARTINRKRTHMLALIVGAISFISIFFITKTDWVLLIPFIGIGLTWASILAMPYAILTGSLPQNKMGVYMGIFNFFIVIPQILAASILGFIVKDIFNGDSIYALIVGGCSFLIAAIAVLFVKDVND
jgi:maltose/moltooligosaccharide transporter